MQAKRASSYYAVAAAHARQAAQELQEQLAAKDAADAQAALAEAKVTYADSCTFSTACLRFDCRTTIITKSMPVKLPYSLLSKTAQVGRITAVRPYMSIQYRPVQA